MPSNMSQLIANVDRGLSFSTTLAKPAIGLLLLILSYFLWDMGKKKPLLPPGPRRLPFFGNFFDLPKEYNWENWAKYKELYGPVFSLTIFGKHLIIINDAEVAIDLLDKRSAIHSNRPHLTFAEDLAGWKGILGLSKYGDAMRVMRKHFHQLIGTPKLASRFHPLEELEAIRLIENLVEHPKTFSQHIRSFVGATVIKATYGYSVNYESDPLVNLANKSMHEFSLAVEGGAWAVDSLPILRWVPAWFPGAEFQNAAKRIRDTVVDFKTAPVNFVRDQMAIGRAFPSLVSSLIENEQTDEDRHLTAMTAISMLGGGADTTVSSLCTFFLAMTIYPEVQAKAQQELDRIVGWDRLPTFEDRDRLPYIDAIVKEVLRWGVVAPLGLPHAALQDDIFMGYCIPKGAIIMPNIWYFLYNPEVYPNPEKFIPERHLAEDGKEVAADPRLYCFGFGRRICPGKEMAESSIFIVIALVLATLNITKARNALGEEITPPYRMTDTLISHPIPFVCDISPRSEKAASLIHSANEEQPFEGGDAKYLSEHIRGKYKSV